MKLTLIALAVRHVCRNAGRRWRAMHAGRIT